VRAGREHVQSAKSAGPQIIAGTPHCATRLVDGQLLISSNGNLEPLLATSATLPLVSFFFGVFLAVARAHAHESFSACCHCRSALTAYITCRVT